MKLDFFSRIKDALSTKAKITYEEKTWKNGELYIKREVKTGPEAEKEIKKHSESFSKVIADFFKDFGL